MSDKNPAGDPMLPPVDSEAFTEEILLVASQEYDWAKVTGPKTTQATRYDLLNPETLRQLGQAMEDRVGSKKTTSNEAMFNLAMRCINNARGASPEEASHWLTQAMCELANWHAGIQETTSA